MEVASKLLSSTSSLPRDASGAPLNPLDARFQALGLSSMRTVDPRSAEFAALCAYATDTLSDKHNGRISIQHAFRVQRCARCRPRRLAATPAAGCRDVEAAAWTDAGFDELADGQRLLLWHGARSTNFAGILRMHHIYSICLCTSSWCRFELP